MPFVSLYGETILTISRPDFFLDPDEYIDKFSGDNYYERLNSLMWFCYTRYGGKVRKEKFKYLRGIGIGFIIQRIFCRYEKKPTVFYEISKIIDTDYRTEDEILAGLPAYSYKRKPKDIYLDGLSAETFVIDNTKPFTFINKEFF